jgi:hypothetical protein
MTVIEPAEVEAEAAAPPEPQTSVFLEIYWPYLWDEPGPPATLGNVPSGS